LHALAKWGHSRPQKSTQPSKLSQDNGVLVEDPVQCITTRRAAKLLGVTQFQVFHLITTERIKDVKLGHDWLVLFSSVEDYH
jgi:hypothetical protein